MAVTAALAPLLVSDLVASLGAPEWAVIGVTALFALYHFRSALLVASQVATAMKVAFVVLALLLVASAGLVPGLDIVVEARELGNWLGDMGGAAWDLLTQLPEVLR